MYTSLQILSTRDTIASMDDDEQTVEEAITSLILKGLVTPAGVDEYGELTYEVTQRGQEVCELIIAEDQN